MLESLRTQLIRAFLETGEKYGESVDFVVGEAAAETNLCCRTMVP